MRSRTIASLLLLLSTWWLTACTPRGHLQENAAYPNGCFEVAPFGKLLERGQILPDVSDVISSESDVPHTSAEDVYLTISADECKCAAADHDELANVVDIEREIALCCKRHPNKSQQQATWLHAELLGYRSAGMRNKAAGESLELFFLLAEVEFGREAITQSLSEVEKIRDYLDRLRVAGLEIEVPEVAVHHRKAELLDRQAKLLLDRARLNSELRRRMGLDVDDPTPIWPETDLKVEVGEINVDAAIATGMAMRPELAASQRMIECLDASTLPQSRGALQVFDAMLGAPAGKSCGLRLLGPDPQCCEWAAREQQLERMLVTMQRAAAEEIRQAVETTKTRLKQISIAKDSMDRRQKTLADLKLQWGGEDVTAFQIIDAKLKVIEARVELVHQVVAWEIARAKLKQAQGLFAFECGYTEAPDDGCFVAADQAVVTEETAIDPAIDGPPAPAPSFVEDDSSDLRQPDSLSGDTAADVGTPETAADKQDQATTRPEDAAADVAESSLTPENPPSSRPLDRRENNPDEPVQAQPLAEPADGEGRSREAESQEPSGTKVRDEARQEPSRGNHLPAGLPSLSQPRELSQNALESDGLDATLSTASTGLPPDISLESEDDHLSDDSSPPKPPALLDLEDPRPLHNKSARLLQPRTLAGLGLEPTTEKQAAHSNRAASSLAQWERTEPALYRQTLRPRPAGSVDFDRESARVRDEVPRSLPQVPNYTRPALRQPESMAKLGS